MARNLATYRIQQIIDRHRKNFGAESTAIILKDLYQANCFSCGGGGEKPEHPCTCNHPQPTDSPGDPEEHPLPPGESTL